MDAARPTRRLRLLSGHLLPCATLSASARHALPKEGGSTVVITGAAGFVGSWLVVKLLARGHTVRACVRDVNNERKVGFLKSLPEMGGRLTLHAADMTVPGAYDSLFEGAHTVFHPAEIFMSFVTGRDLKAAAEDFGGKATFQAMHESAMRSSRSIVDSINKSSSVRRLIYTSSIAALMRSSKAAWVADPDIDESSEPSAQHMGEHSYSTTKRSTEHFFAYHAASSGGKWSVLTANPSDIVGPVLSPHQATETWQGKIGQVIQGIPTEQEMAGRPWFLVDARDVAEAEILLAESTEAESGERFLVSSGDHLYPESIGSRVMELFPSYDCATTALRPASLKPKGGPQLRNEPFWIRVNLRNDKIRRTTGMSFHGFDATLRATVESLVKVGGIKPKSK